MPACLHTGDKGGVTHGSLLEGGGEGLPNVVNSQGPCVRVSGGQLADVVEHCFGCDCG